MAQGESWFDVLADRLRMEQQSPCVFTSSAARFLFARHGARLLAIEMTGDDELCGDLGNLLFIADVPPPRYGGKPGFDVGKVTGGDRLWLAPEVAWFWPSIEKAREDPKRHAATPDQLDPGQYQVTAQGRRHMSLRNQVPLIDNRNGRRITVEVQRSFRVIDTPYAALGFERFPKLIAASFSLTHDIEVLDGDPDATCGAWSILQIPPGGTLICPTVRALTRPQLRSYYDSFDRNVTTDDDAVCVRIDGRNRMKLGMRPEDCAGRMGYYRRATPQCSTLILRVFPTLPGEHYVDVPRSEPTDTYAGGDVLQVYNDDGDAFGGSVGSRLTFGEMEYHDPAVTPAGVTRRSGSSVTHVLAGPDEQIRFIGEKMLGVPLRTID